MRASLVSLPSLVVGGAVFVILFVILGVTLWVSIVAGAGALVLAALVGTATAVTRDSHPHHA
jgi:hypothetical protein